MKVAHLTSVHPPFDTRIFHKECATLVDNGFEVVLIAPNDRADIVGQVRLTAVHAADSLKARVFRTIPLVLKAAFQERAKIYHLHDPELIVVGLLLRFMGKTVIYDVHEDLPLQVMTKPYIKPILRGAVSACATSLEWIAGLAFNGIVVAHQEVAIRFPLHKTVVVQNYPMDKEIVSGFGDYKGRANVATYIGGISVIRGIREMIMAVDRLRHRPNFKLLLAGKFHSRTLEQDMQRLPGWDLVDWRGWVERSEVPSLLGGARVGLLLLHAGHHHLVGQPTKLYDYMAAGIPVVASNLPNYRRILDEFGCGLAVDPMDIDGVAAAIEWLLDHPEESEAMGQRGQRAVLDRFVWSAEARRLVELYNRLL